MSDMEKIRAGLHIILTKFGQILSLPHRHYQPQHKRFFKTYLNNIIFNTGMKLDLELKLEPKLYMLAFLTF